MVKCIFERALALVIVTMLLSTAIVSTAAAMGSERSSELSTLSSMKSTGPIRVDSDAELASLIVSNDWNGTGTFRDPYMMENLVIAAGGAGNGIFLGNITSSWVVIRNCTVTGASHHSDPYSNGAGIDTYNSRNVMLERNNLTSNVYGFCAFYCENLTLRKNNCSGNSLGVFLYTTSNSSVTDSKLNSGNAGLYLMLGSNNNTVELNDCSNNLYQGIYVIFSCCNNTIRSNNCSKIGSDSTNAGILLAYSSSYNIISNNTCNDNVNSCGIYLANRCVRNIVSNNTCLRNSLGIHVYLYSIFNDVEHNLVGNNQYGLSLMETNNTLLKSNNCTSNQIYGIWLRDANYNDVIENYISNNVEFGIYVFTGNGNSFVGNIINGNNGAGTSFVVSHTQAFDAGSNLWNSSTQGNHWGDWTSPDANGDSIVDYPYVIMGWINEDHYPLVGTSLSGITILSPGSPSYTRSSSVQIAGTASSYAGFKSINWYNAATHTEGLCTGTASWSGTVPLVAGTNDISVNMTDGLDHLFVDTVTVIYDATAPTLSITSPADNSYNNTGRVTVKWSGSDATSGLDYFNITVDGGTPIRLASTVSSRSINGLTDGVHTVKVTAVDRAGNAISRQISFTVDTEGPLVMITPGQPIYTNGTQVQISIDVSSDVPLTSANSSRYQNGVLLNDQDLTSTYVGETHVVASITLDLVEGHSMFFLTVNDSAGNSVLVKRDIYCDRTNPTVHITSPMNGLVMNSASATVTWTSGASISGVAYYNISIDGAAPVKLSSSTLSYVIRGLAEGNHTVAVTVVNNVNNQTTAVIAFSIDTIAPSLSIISPTIDSYVNASSLQVVWTVSDVHLSSIEARVDDGVWQTVAIGSLSTTLAGLSDGPHLIEVRTADSAGNKVTKNVTVTVDTIAPTARITPAIEEVGLNATFQVIFSESMRTDSVSISIAGVTSTVTWNGNTATLVPSDLVYNGNYVISVNGVDLAGNHIHMDRSFNTTRVGEIFGTLLDSNGKPIANATVTLNGSLVTYSDELGNFRFANMTVGSYTMTIHKDGFDDITKEITVTKEMVFQPGNLSMAASKSGGQDVTLYIIVGVVAIAAVAGAVLVLRRAKK